MTGRGSTSEPRVTDEELMLLYQQGEEDAFTELVHRYKNKIVSTAYRVVGDYAKAEDVAQETFLRVHRNAARYRSIARFSTWIYTIALNVARNELRNTKRKRLVSLDGFGAATDSDQGTYDIPDESSRPDDDASDRELNEIIHRTLKRLPVRYRTVLVLRDVQELTYEEIAEILKVPKGTVKSRMNRARQKFKELVEPILGETFGTG
ncbi:MAG: sigma-70 family RNA polymerase sigma factor [Candidatus Eisenbacteria bacterium]|nr:sigma-70 family RNA polymerase sigma factor [Candidatus Eisenbacteria bacterium]